MAESANVSRVLSHISYPQCGECKTFASCKLHEQETYVHLSVVLLLLACRAYARGLTYSVRLSVCNVGGLWSHSAMKSVNRHDRIDRCLCYRHTKADLDCFRLIPSSRILPKKTSGCGTKWSFALGRHTASKRLACRTISACAEPLL